MTTPRTLALALLACLSVSPLEREVRGQERLGTFTSPPRSVRVREFDQRHLRLVLDFDFEGQAVQARAVHTLAPFRPLSEITFDAAELQVKRVRLLNDDAKAGDSEAGESEAGKELDHSMGRGKLIVRLGREHAAGEELRLAIDYRIARPRHGIHFVVPDESEPSQPVMAWTQSEPEYARYWFPCFDSPADRLTSETLVTVPDSFTVLSNGKLMGKTVREEGRVTWHWSQEKDHVPYLISVVAGEFAAYEQSYGDKQVVSYMPAGRAGDAPRSFEKTPAMMRFFSQQIGYDYPWSKYTQICVDEYMWGGMEHTTATTLNLGTLHDERAHLDVSSDNLVAHELAHQWWGDLLTCKDWGELWLNESFATYFATLWKEHDEGWDEAAWQGREETNDYLNEDRKYRRPIVTYRYRRPIDMFDSHSYPKGGRVLHMLRFELGDESFWRAMNRYATVNAHRTVETADLRIAVEEATGDAMTWFFDQWIYHGGHPEFAVTWRWDEEAKMVRLNVKQTQKPDDLTPVFRSGVEIEIATPDETITRRVTIREADESFHFDVARRPTRVCFDPRNWVLKTLDFPKSKEELLDQLAHCSHVICRARAAEQLAELKDDGDAEAGLIAAAGGDEFWGVRREAVKALGKFKGEDVRAALIAAASGDEKSFVRREAIQALGNFQQDDTSALLREVIAGDRSYYAVAEALKTLVKVDRDGCRADLAAALDVSSHEDVILSAATDGLAELGDDAAADKLADRLSRPLDPHERVVVIGALARLKRDDAEVAGQLRRQLDNDRPKVRRAAVDALVKVGGPEAIEALLARRDMEESAGMVTRIDEAVDKLRGADRDLEKLRRELESLRRQNGQLEERLNRLEEKQ